tara:strand:- start:1126 stop:1626 length:501 start_codon:yes stop_codon:yes gene_type:complete
MRGPRKNKVDYGRPDIYKFYKKDGNDLLVSQSLHAKVLNSFNKKLSKIILEEAFEYIIPQRVGALRIKKYKPRLIDNEGNLIKKNLKPDWKATNELWARDEKAKENKTRVYHTNKHSDGYEYKWHFSNYRSNCVNKSAYCFLPSRTNKRGITALVTDENFEGDYYI